MAGFLERTNEELEGVSTDTIFTLEPPTTSIIVGVKAGTNISISTDGIISSTDTNTIYTLPTASTTVTGGIRIGVNLTMTGDVLSADTT